MSKDPVKLINVQPIESHSLPDSDDSSGFVPEGDGFGRKIKEASETDVRKLSDSASPGSDMQSGWSVREERTDLKERVWEKLKNFASLLPFIHKRRLNNVVASEDSGGVKLISHKPISESERDSGQEAAPVKSTRKKRKKLFDRSESKHVGDELFKQAKKQKDRVQNKASRGEWEQALRDQSSNLKVMAAKIKLAKDCAFVSSCAEQSKTLISEFTEWDETKLVVKPSDANRDIHGDPLRTVTTNLFGLKALPPEILKKLSVNPEDLLQREVAGRSFSEWGNRGTYAEAVKDGFQLQQIKEEIIPVLDEVVLLMKEAK